MLGTQPLACSGWGGRAVQEPCALSGVFRNQPCIAMVQDAHTAPPAQRFKPDPRFIYLEKNPNLLNSPLWGFKG